MRLITTVKERCILYLPVIRQFGGGNRNLQIYFGNNLVQIFDFHQNCIWGKCVSPGSGANVTFVLLGCSSPRSVSHPICEFFANVCTSMLTIVFFHQGKTGSMKAAPRRWRGKQLKHAETPDDHPSHQLLLTKLYFSLVMDKTCFQRFAGKMSVRNKCLGKGEKERLKQNVKRVKIASSPK